MTVVRLQAAFTTINNIMDHPNLNLLSRVGTRSVKKRECPVTQQMNTSLNISIKFFSRQLNGFIPPIYIRINKLIHIKHYTYKHGKSSKLKAIKQSRILLIMKMR